MMLLELHGHVVRVVNHPQNVIAAVREFDPEVAVVDLQLVKKNDGYEVADIVRKECNKCKIVIASGHSLPEDIALSKHHGYKHHLVKPVDPSKLNEIIHEECESSRLCT